MENKNITADEMHKLATSEENRVNKDELNTILDLIHTAASKAERDISYGSSLSPAVKTALILRGFKCDYYPGYDQRDPPYYLIKW